MTRGAPLSREHPQFRARATGLVHAVASRVLAEVTRAAQQRGISLLPVKGIVTAYVLHDRPEDRPIADVDVRLRPEDFHPFLSVARERGWRRLEYSRAYRSAVFEIAGLMLDVETSVGPPGLCDLRVADMLARARPVRRSDGLEVLHPELHDHALLLAVNAFKDKMMRAAEWSLDDAHRIVCEPALEPARLARLARASSSSSLLWIVADWMAGRGEAGAQRWVELRRQLEPVPRHGYARALRRLVEFPPSVPLILPIAARLAADRRAMRWEAILRAAAWQFGRALA